MMVYSGVRISDLLSITRFHVDTHSGVITRGAKKDVGKNRINPIHLIIKLHNGVGWLERTRENLICDDKRKKILLRGYRERFYYPSLDLTRVKRLTPHTCRHTFGSFM